MSVPNEASLEEKVRDRNATCVQEGYNKDGFGRDGSFYMGDFDYKDVANLGDSHFSHQQMEWVKNYNNSFNFLVVHELSPFNDEHYKRGSQIAENQIKFKNK
ncbi:hypothetical protein MMC10_002486 [Thelotrema lepadinum]|nr:hypothetical protein [Thelotrema lepadinum]